MRNEEDILYGLIDKRNEEDLKIQRTSNYFYNLSKKGIGSLSNNDNNKVTINNTNKYTFVSNEETIINNNTVVNNNTFININVNFIKG